ncbi:MAG: glycosyltransferase [Alphaproteobacteria bacterium]|nr:glycosyltransferase [Alphaproteobacteria bacterium]
MSIKISCIIPLYNAENYIKRCLDSVLKQSISDFEVIIIDDGSKDNSLSIVEQYTVADNRIKLIQQSNQGVSIARNNGIREALGEYIFFLDADDDIMQDAFKDSYKKAVADSADILVFNYSKVYKNKYSLKKKKLKDSKIYSSVKEKKIVLSSGVTPWSKIYRREFLLQHNILFFPKIYYEDIPFFWKSVILANKMSFLNKSIYNYYQNSHSIMNSNLTNKKIDDIIKSMLLVRDYLFEYNMYHSYKAMYEIKIIKTFIEFFSNSTKNKKVFRMMSQNLNFIDIKVYKKDLSFFKYLKYKYFLSGRYFIYRLFFAQV